MLYVIVQVTMLRDMKFNASYLARCASLATVGPLYHGLVTIYEVSANITLLCESQMCNFHTLYMDEVLQCSTFVTSL